MKKTRTQVIARLQVEGIHRWLQCPIPEVSYLKNYHRHMFHIEATTEVTQMDREVEFIELAHEIKTHLHNKYFSTHHQCLFLEDLSCEMIAQELVQIFNLTSCSVSEDGEGGAIVTIR